MSKAYLVFSDGTAYEGTSFGAPVTACGELVFNTGVVGYIETLTDPAYAGQILLQTFPQMGNYGIIEEDFDGECHLRGYVVREWCETPSNFRCEYTLDKFLKDRGIPGICGVDTRAITRKIRDEGVMPAMICAEIPADLSVIKAEKISVTETGCKEAYEIPGEGMHVAVIDYGMKKSLTSYLEKKGCRFTVLPADASTQSVFALNPDGVLLSGGPGDPRDVDLSKVKALLGKVPMLGVGLGHQLIALAAGGEVQKMKYGHRGGNQPVRYADTGRTYITGQNHGYEVTKVVGGETILVNANDGTCEGAYYPAHRALSVQFQPDTIPGPQDASFLYDRFISMMGGEN